MNNRKPNITSQKKICIICEGYEEYEYLETLINLGVWNKAYKIFPINAESNGKIPARYQEKYMSDSYDIVLIFCDTDEKPFEDYTTIKQKIDIIHGVNNSANEVIIYANPCTMQIILLHFADIRLTSHKKDENSKQIKALTGIGSYRAQKKQRDRLNAQITISNYRDMIQRASQLLKDDAKLGSSNFDVFASYLENEDYIWINKINEILES